MERGTYIAELDELQPDRDVVLTIGMFDGVHLGHQNLIHQVRRRGRELGGQSAVLTFYPHPRAVLDPESSPSYLNTLEERLDLLASLGVDVIARLRFTRELSRYTADEFLQLVLRHLRLRELWGGPEFTLGYQRQGTASRLAEIGRGCGFVVHQVAPLSIDGDVVSSTRVRHLLAAGDVAAAGRLLGRCPNLKGQVVPGAHRGHSLGFPTANLATAPGRALPRDGIYAAHAILNAESYYAVVNIGTRPTFDNGERLVEAYLLDFDRDIYGRCLELCFVQRLRDEQRFASAADLVAQMQRDVAQARAILAHTEACA